MSDVLAEGADTGEAAVQGMEEAAASAMITAEGALMNQLTLLSLFREDRPYLSALGEPRGDVETKAWQSALIASLSGETFLWLAPELDMVLRASTALPVPTWPARSELFAPAGFAQFETEMHTVGETYQNISWVSDSACLRIIIHHHTNDGRWQPAFINVPWTMGSQDKMFANKEEFFRCWPFIALFVSMNLFINQTILVRSRQRLSRAARRRLSPELAERLVSVITLRRKRYTQHANGDGDLVDWSCRWIVRGHWRRQWYPSLDLHQPRWITPYVKGPEDKPVRTSKMIFAVVR